MQIYWPGFFANSTLSAITLSLIVFATIKYRRYLRSRRDQCTACGYDLRGAEHDQCPECGMVMKRSGHS
ncbi:MAG: hypothetical protein O7G85_13700 [Planctomycetota bacterium]|nr:hypothetical protein [Planctomycetota bacterium]